MGVRDGERFAALRTLMSAGEARGHVNPTRRWERFEQTFGGKVVRDPKGDAYVLCEQMDGAYVHGHGSLRSVLEVGSGALAQIALDVSLCEVDVSRALFFDTETTGLVGGAGTLVFVLGMGWFEGDRFVTERYFLPEPGMERGMLHRFCERLGASTLLVSFNGKSFDLPLMRARLIMNRIPLPEVPPHLDLLHCARRIFRGRLPSSQLSVLEARVLGVTREGDVPGSEAPARYGEFLRSGHFDHVTCVLDHNLQDVLSLCTLASQLAWRVHRPEEVGDAHEALAYARLADRSGHPELCEAFADLCVNRDEEGMLAAQALVLRAKHARRDGRDDDALTFLRRAWRRAGSAQRAGIALRLSKHLEHRIHGYEEALRFATHALGAESTEEYERRVSRIRAKLARAQRASDRTGLLPAIS